MFSILSGLGENFGMAVTEPFNPNQDLQEEMEIETIESHLALDIVYHTSGLIGMNPSNQHAHTMRHVVAKIIQRNELKLNSCMLQMNISEENSGWVFDAVLNEMFNDNRMNWGRVATVYALAGKLAKYCYDNELVRLVGRIGREAGNYVAVHLKHWIEEQGGWVCHLNINLFLED